MIGLVRGKAYQAPCTVLVEQTESEFHAHVELADDIAIGPGDRVRVNGERIVVPFGQTALFARTATVEPAGPLLRAWTRIAAHFELGELYEVSFTSRRLS